MATSCVTHRLDHISGPTHAHNTIARRRKYHVVVVSINALPRARIYGYQENINWLSIDYACRPRLGSTHPGKTNLTQEPLVIRRDRFSLSIRYSCLHSHSYTVHDSLSIASNPCTTLPYPAYKNILPRLRRCLEHYIVAQNHSTSELLRTLSGWLLLSQPPGCLRDLTSFSIAHPGALTGDLGCSLDYEGLSPQSLP